VIPGVRQHRIASVSRLHFVKVKVKVKVNEQEQEQEKDGIIVIMYVNK